MEELFPKRKSLKRKIDQVNNNHGPSYINSLNDSPLSREIYDGWDISLTTDYLKQIELKNRSLKQQMRLDYPPQFKCSYEWEYKQLTKWERKKPWITMKYPKVRCYSVNSYPSIWKAQQKVRMKHARAIWELNHWLALSEHSASHNQRQLRHEQYLLDVEKMDQLFIQSFGERMFDKVDRSRTDYGWFPTQKKNYYKEMLFWLPTKYNGF